MREIRTYGLKRGPPHRQHLGGVLYSTRGNRLFHSAATFQPLHRPPRPGLPTLRPRSGQPCSPFETGVLLVRRPARRTPVRRRGRVLSKPPRLKGFRPASAPTEAARGHPGRVRRHGLRLSSGASSRNRAFSPSLERASAGLRTLEAASPAAAARFLRYLFAARLCLALARRVTAAERGARFERANPSDREGEPTVARESFAGPA